MSFPLPTVRLLELDWRDVADRLEQTPMIKPVYPLEGGELDRLDALPRWAALDRFGLELSDD